ncbi:hypothetical protein [Acidipropionibacterium timonense]|uniref:hypothetical protein n=1 Tax=Acidipropionibacterium timonense TaxID=2161818 RepID=UPI00103078DA|nr:hypothetical protein [Acidipropionibacterium timonense]
MASQKSSSASRGGAVVAVLALLVATAAHKGAMVAVLAIVLLTLLGMTSASRMRKRLERAALRPEAWGSPVVPTSALGVGTPTTAVVTDQPTQRRIGDPHEGFDHGIGDQHADVATDPAWSAPVIPWQVAGIPPQHAGPGAVRPGPVESGAMDPGPTQRGPLPVRRTPPPGAGRPPARPVTAQPVPARPVPTRSGPTQSGAPRRSPAPASGDPIPEPPVSALSTSCLTAGTSLLSERPTSCLVGGAGAEGLGGPRLSGPVEGQDVHLPA